MEEEIFEEEFFEEEFLEEEPETCSGIEPYTLTEESYIEEPEFDMDDSQYYIDEAQAEELRKKREKNEWITSIVLSVIVSTVITVLFRLLVGM